MQTTFDGGDVVSDGGVLLLKQVDVRPVRAATQTSPPMATSTPQLS